MARFCKSTSKLASYRRTNHWQSCATPNRCKFARVSMSLMRFAFKLGNQCACKLMPCLTQISRAKFQESVLACTANKSCPTAPPHIWIPDQGRFGLKSNQAFRSLLDCRSSSGLTKCATTLRRRDSSSLLFRKAKPSGGNSSESRLAINSKF